MATTIVSKATGDLHPTIEAIERIEQGLADLAKKEDVSLEVQRALDPMTEAMDEIKGRVIQLEGKYRGSGEKYFEGDTDKHTSAYNSLGRVITAARQYSRDKTLPEGFQRAQTEGTDTAGGVLVPTATYADVIQAVGEKSLMRKLCQVINMPTDKMVMPIRSTVPAAEWPSEGAAGTDVSVVLIAASSSTLDSATMVVLDSVSRELSEDALKAIEGWLGNTLSEAVAKEENKQLLVGTGSPFTGIVNTSGVPVYVQGGSSTSGKTAFSNVSFDDLWQTEFAIDGDVIGEGQTPAFVCRKEFFQYAYSLKDSSGYPIWASSWSGFPHDGGAQKPSAPAGRPQNLAGVPAYLTKVMAASAATTVGLVHGDFSKAIMGDRRALSVEWDDSIYFKERKRAVLVSERIAFLVAIPTAFALLKTSTT